jgi:hypothetical protein
MIRFTPSHLGGDEMKDQDKTKKQLINDLESLRKSLRQCTTELQARNRDLDDVARYLLSEFKGPLGLIIGFADLLEEGYATLSEGEMRHSVRTIKRSGRRMSEMVNALLLLANSRRLFDNVWHAAYLAAMGEASLSQWVDEEKNVSEVYRFTCLPASLVPLIVRAWRTAGETTCFQIIAKLGSDQVDAESKASTTLQEAQQPLAAEEWMRFVDVVEGSGFWSDASSLEQLNWSRMVGTGGEEWIFEGWRDGQYRARAVWNPGAKKGHAAYALGRSFICLLPGWFALEIARFWVADSWPRMERGLGEELELEAAA